ncbi:MAG: hypothetical protein JW819_07455 [Candidatus Krumholzibacteriota bacterium]|nr:hypothetical protein [Candidatus Krumholzibacteriota bacterium]
MRLTRITSTTVLLIAGLAIGSVAAAEELRLVLDFPRQDLHWERQDGLDRIRLAGCSSLEQPGRPLLPARLLRVALPGDALVTAVRAEDLRRHRLPGRFHVAPAPGPTAIDAELPARPVAPDPAIYGSAAPFPENAVTLLGQGDLAGQVFALLRVCPLSFDPGTGELLLIERLAIVVEFTRGWRCGDYLPAGASPTTRGMYHRQLAALVANPDAIALRGGVDPRTGGRGVPPGSYEHVIITGAAWTDDFQPLADWRTRIGRRTAIVSTSWICEEGGYAGGTPLEQIRAFVADAHATWGATSFLLGGDTPVIPCHHRIITIPGYFTHDVPNDTYYADYDDDWVCEVAVGRLSARTDADIAAYTAKVLAYEKDPPRTGYATTAVSFGFDISACGDMSGEICKEWIRAAYLPADWTLATEYDAEPGGHREDVLAYLAHGYHLVNHHDHCHDYCLGTGWICHGDLIYTSELAALANAGRYGLLFAVGCNPCDITATTSIAEAYVLNAGGGGMAFMGDSRTGWGGPAEDPILYTVRQDAFFYRNLFALGVRRLGENFMLLKNDEYVADDPLNLHQYCFTQLFLLGDPELPVWTADPRELAVAHPGELLAGQAVAFTVAVSCEGMPVDGATVCLWQGEDLHLVETTVAGAASFDFTPPAAGELLVTVTGTDYLPYEGSAAVTTDPTAVADAAPTRLELRAAVPNPFNPGTRLVCAIPARPGPARLGIYDSRGRRVRVLVEGTLPAGVHGIPWDGRDDAGRRLASGVYFARLSLPGRAETRRLVLLK